MVVILIFFQGGYYMNNKNDTKANEYYLINHKTSKMARYNPTY